MNSEAVALILLGCCIALTTQAQTAPDAGQVLRENRPAPAAGTPTASPALRAEEAVERASSSSARFDVTSIRVTGNVAFSADALATLVASTTGKQRSLADLEAAARTISAYYRSHGYAVARAMIPAQDIRDGVVQIVVVEGVLGARLITNQNESLTSTKQVQAILGSIATGEPVKTDSTNRALLLLGDLPGAGKVDGRLRPGDRVGSSDLLITMTPGKTIEGGVSLDNFGNRFTGANRLTAQLNINNPAGLADRLSLRGTVSEAHLLYGRAAWDTALGAQGLRLGVAASASRYELGKDFAALQANGSVRTAGLYATYPLLLTPEFRVRTGATLERREITDNIDSTNSSVKKTANVLVAELSGDAADAIAGGGVTTWRINPTLGQLSIASPAARATDQSSARTEGRYLKWVASLSREQRMTNQLSFYASVSRQWASRNLDSSEKFVLGGSYGIRAYPQGEAAGDEGWLANIELRYAAIPGLTGSVFYDAGSVRVNRNPFNTARNHRHLSGYGLGLATTIDNLSLSATLAWRGPSESPTSDVDKSPRFWAQAVWRF